MTLPGTIALLGSGEFEPWTEELDRTLLAHATSGDGTVAIVPTASALEGPTFDDWAEKGLKHYRGLGIPARRIDLRGRDDAERSDLLSAIEGTSMIFFSGGNPAYLARTLAGSAFWDAVVARVRAGAVFAGCSGGACVAGSFAPESVTEFVWEEGWTAGLELLPNVWILPHFDALDRHRRVLRGHFLSRIPETSWSLGIDEGTAVVRLGDAWSVFGGGGAFLARGRSARRFAAGESFTFEGLDSLAADRDLVLAVEPLPQGAGPIALVSSDQFAADTVEVDRALIERCGPRVGIVLEADPSHASGVEEEAIRHYRSLGGDPVRLRPTDAPGDVDLVFLAGGDPKELVPALQHSPLWTGALRAWRTGLGLAGSSAGAMALSEWCLFADPGEDLPFHWGRGLGPLRSAALAPHAATRPEDWLQDVVAGAACDVIALDEGSALLLTPGNAPAVMGAGRVRSFAGGAAPRTSRRGVTVPTVRLYHRTAAAEDILRLGFMDSLENRSRDGAWEGSWFSDTPLSTTEGPDGNTFLVLDVPREIAERFEWPDGRKPYREFVLPREIANRFGPPSVLALDGTLREPDPELLERGEPVWGRGAQG
ncbi:MAG: Type 1 glutamine amidotransferase-like domain-containing protein [Actinomycetota bacterium]|nr:Type 1 glutamine amidotransferase-like domain-containing protein [Actinomycetota bacterium]